MSEIRRRRILHITSDMNDKTSPNYGATPGLAWQDYYGPPAVEIKPQTANHVGAETTEREERNE